MPIERRRNMNSRTITELIVSKAIALGAAAAGIANIQDLKSAPAFVMMPQRPHFDRVGAVENTTGLPEGVVAWKEEMRSVLVIAYEHPEEKPYLDCWLDGKNPPGNLELIKINKKLKEYIEAEIPGVKTEPLNYYVEKGGVWLKDASVVAGLGTIGKNNLLITKEYGPRVRLRAMFLSVDLPSTGPGDWDPCAGCDMPCRKKCPQNAFDRITYEAGQYGGLTKLPGRDGSYSLLTCDRQMAEDEENEIKTPTEVPDYGTAVSIIKYCRECELNCRIKPS